MDGVASTVANDGDAGEHDDDSVTTKGVVFQRLQESPKDKDSCTICLQPVAERAVAVPCNHLTFDFLCLVSWLQERSSCPLCNAEVTHVQYDFREPQDFKTYRVPRRGPVGKIESDYQNLRRRRGQDFIRRRAQRQDAGHAEDPAFEQRRQVYRERLYALHVGANSISGYHDFTSSEFANSSDLQSRARMFLRRELQVFSFLDTPAAPRGGNREFLLEYIVAVLKTHELKGANGHAEDMLAEYLGRENARLLLHELGAWLRSPRKRLVDWDAEVQYTEFGSSGDGKRSEGG